MHNDPALIFAPPVAWRQTLDGLFGETADFFAAFEKDSWHSRHRDSLDFRCALVEALRFVPLEQFCRHSLCYDKSSLRIVRAGEERHLSSSEFLKSRVRQVHEFLQSGHTIVFGAIDGAAPALSALKDRIESAFPCLTTMNLYLTPPGNQGFKRHFDTHDVIAIQISGEKQWTVESRLERLQEFKTLLGEKFSEPKDVIMRPGDLLYIPRGLAHSAVNRGDTDSLHLTIGIITCTKRAIIRALCDLMAGSGDDLLHSVTWNSFLTEAGARTVIPVGRQQVDKLFFEALLPLMNLSENEAVRAEALLRALGDTVCQLPNPEHFSDTMQRPGEDRQRARAEEIALVAQPRDNHYRVISSGSGFAEERTRLPTISIFRPGATTDDSLSQQALFRALARVVTPTPT